jgi:hypothetical protein
VGITKLLKLSQNFFLLKADITPSHGIIQKGSLRNYLLPE